MWLSVTPTLFVGAPRQRRLDRGVALALDPPCLGAASSARRAADAAGPTRRGVAAAVGRALRVVLGTAAADVEAVVIQAVVVSGGERRARRRRRRRSRRPRARRRDRAAPGEVDDHAGGARRGEPHEASPYLYEEWRDDERSLATATSRIRSFLDEHTPSGAVGESDYICE